MLIYLLLESLKFTQILGFVEIYQLILDPLQMCKIGFSKRGLVVVVKKSGDPIEFNIELGDVVIVFHDQLFKFNFGISDCVIWTKFDHELLWLSRAETDPFDNVRF